MKKIIISLILVLLMGSIIEAPVKTTPDYVTVRVRLTAYSPKQPREGNKNCIGGSAKNETGCAVSRYLRTKYGIKNGDTIEFPNGDRRIVDDKPARWAEKKFRGYLVDRRYYESLKSKPETKAINRELCKRFDKSWGIIKIIPKIF